MVEVIDEHRVVSMTTTSLREILKMFSADDEAHKIFRLKAGASKQEEMDPYMEDDEYGVVGYLDRGSDTFDIDYQLRFDEKGNPTNPIDNSGVNDIERYMDRLGIEDAPVDYMELLINDSEIGEITDVDEEIFQATLVSDPCDGEADKEKVKEHSLNESLIKDCGFKYRVLNCRKLIDRRQVLTKKRTQQEPLILWRGETAVSLNSPIKLAQKLREHFEPYQLLKKFGADEEDVLRLMEVSR